MTLKLNQPCGQTREEKKKKETFKRKTGEGKRGKKAKKKKNQLQAAHNFFFLKRKSFESLAWLPGAWGAPLWGRAARGGGAPPPLSACERGSVTSFIPPSSGFLLLCCCFFVGQEGGLDFLFLQAGAEPVLSARAAVSILSRSPLKLLQVPPTT